MPLLRYQLQKKIGLGADDPEVITGKELETMSDKDLFNKVKTVSAYARVSPQHKLRITQQLLKHGEVVAVTGDGVNDAPALRAAHIGIAYGQDIIHLKDLLSKVLIEI